MKDVIGTGQILLNVAVNECCTLFYHSHFNMKHIISVVCSLFINTGSSGYIQVITRSRKFCHYTFLVYNYVMHTRIHR